MQVCDDLPPGEGRGLEESQHNTGQPGPCQAFACQVSVSVIIIIVSVSVTIVVIIAMKQFFSFL